MAESFLYLIIVNENFNYLVYTNTHFISAISRFNEHASYFTTMIFISAISRGNQLLAIVDDIQLYSYINLSIDSYLKR